MKKLFLIFLFSLILIILFSQNILACSTTYSGTCSDVRKFLLVGGSNPCGTWTTGSGSCTWSCATSPTGYTCSSCYCICSLTNECSSGAKECLSSTTYRTCGFYDGDCALEWSSSQTCSSGTTCSAGTCTSCVACTLGTTQCSGTQIQTCESYGNGCTQWSTATNCPTSQTCVSGTCTNIEHKINITVSTEYCVEHSVNRCDVGEKISLVINSSNYCTFWGATGWNLRYRNVSGSDYTYLTLGSFNCVDGNSVVNFTVPTYPSSTYTNSTSPIFGKSHAIISFNRETPSGNVADYSSDVNIISPLITVSSISSNCQITSAQMINSSCDMNGCKVGDKINLSVNVADASKCLNINKIEIDASSGGVVDPKYSSKTNNLKIPDLSFGTTICELTLTNTTPIKTGNQYNGIWTISSIDSSCYGEIVYANIAQIYNTSSSTNPIASNSGDYGSFKFGQLIILPTYNVSVSAMTSSGEIIGNTHPILDGIIQNEYFQTTLRNIPQGMHTINGTVKSGYTANPVTMNITQNLEGLIIVYNNSVLTTFNFNITAKDKNTGAIISAPIVLKITNSSGIFTSSTVTNGNLIYNYLYNYPMNYTITFGSVLGYSNTPGKIQGNVNNDGFLWLNVYYIPSILCTCDGIPLNTCINATHRCQLVSNQCKPVLCPVSLPVCDLTINQCTTEIVPTCNFGSDPTCTDSLCFWNSTKCKACSTNDPTSCSSYKTQYACEKDNCGMNINGAGSDICSIADSCSCDWNSLSASCSLVANYEGEGSCTSIVIAQTECGESCSGNQRLVTYDRTWTGASETNPDCVSGSTCIACAGFRLLPGFDYINLILVLGLLAGYYGYSFVKKR